MSTKRIFYMKAFNLVLTGLLLGIIVWLLVTLILGVIYQPEYSNDIKVTVNFNNKPVEGTETVETTRQVPVTCPFGGETKTSEVKTVVKTTKAEPSERRVVITEDAFKETMQQVAYTARQKAQNEYDKNFTTLLTILTIFGIAWPVIIALLQFKFNEHEISKINQAQKNSEDALKKANTACEQAVNNNSLTHDLLQLSQKLHTENLKRSRISFDTYKVVFGSMAMVNPDFSDYYYILALRSTVWSIQATKELGYDDKDFEDMIFTVGYIKPQCKFKDVTSESYNFLIHIKQDLQKTIEAKGRCLELVIQLFALLDEKIAEYEKLLAVTDGDEK